MDLLTFVRSHKRYCVCLSATFLLILWLIVYLQQPNSSDHDNLLVHNNNNKNSVTRRILKKDGLYSVLVVEDLSEQQHDATTSTTKLVEEDETITAVYPSYSDADWSVQHFEEPIFEWFRSKRHSDSHSLIGRGQLFDMTSQLGDDKSIGLAIKERSLIEDHTTNNNGDRGILYPDLLNIVSANYTEIEASSTCGLDIDSPEMYCQLVGGSVFKTDQIIDGQSCDYCVSAYHSNKSHNIRKILLPSYDNWWMSPPLSRGLQYKQVNVTMSFRQPFEIEYLILTMANSPRPDVWILEKSMDFGETWQVWQYFTTSSDNCQDYFPHASEKIEREDSVICTHEYSGILPLEAGEIPVSLVKGRPRRNMTKLLQFITATNVRFKFIKPTTVSGASLDSEPRPGMSRRMFYSLQRVDIVARCTCNGHADRCSDSSSDSHQVSVVVANNNSDIDNETSSYIKTNLIDRRHLMVTTGSGITEQTSRLKCHCLHNTQGDQCETCKPPYVQKRWRPAHAVTTGGGSRDGENEQWTGRQAAPVVFQCELCNCHNHSNKCQYNATVDELKLSMDIHGQMEGGGVCLDCEHNTTGVNCNQCRQGYYHPSNRDWNHQEACVRCDCDIRFTTGVCDINGHCECRPEFRGKKECSQCKPRYFGDNSKKTCQQCDCNWLGASSCDSATGACRCHQNVVGKQCDQCLPNYFGLPTGLGCRPCNCGLGAQSSRCNLHTGQCLCREGLMGRQCDQCDYDHFNYNTTTGTCHRCQCNANLSNYNDIVQRNNQLTTYLQSATAPVSSNGTHQQHHHKLERLCNEYDGHCNCKKNVVGKQCDQCRERYVVDYESTGCKACQGECTDELFAQMDLIKSTLDDTLSHLDRNRENRAKMDKVNRWRDELADYGQYFERNRQQLTNSIRDFGRIINVTIITEDIGNHLSLFNTSHLARALQQINGVGSKFEQLNEIYLGERHAQIEVMRQMLTSELNKVNLIKFNSLDASQSIWKIINRYYKFMRQFGVPQLTNAESELTYCNPHNQLCEQNKMEENNEANIVTMLQTFQLTMNDTRRLQESLKIAPAYSLNSKLSVEVGWFKLRYERVRNESENMRQQLVEATYKDAFRTLLGDYATLELAVNETRSLISKHWQQSASTISGDDEQNDALMIHHHQQQQQTGGMSIVSLRGARAKLDETIGKLTIYGEKINDFVHVKDRVSKKAAIVDDYLSKKSIIDIRVNLLKIAAQNNRKQKESLDNLTTRDTLVKLKQEAQNESYKIQVMLESHKNYQYLLIDANATMRSLLQLNNGLMQQQQQRDNELLLRMQANTNELIRAMEITKLAGDLNFLSTEMQSGLDELRDKLNGPINTDYENLKGDYVHLTKRAEQVSSLITEGLSRSRNVFTRQSLELASKVKILNLMAGNESQRQQKLLGMLRKTRNNIERIKRDRLCIKRSQRVAGTLSASFSKQKEYFNLISNKSAKEIHTHISNNSIGGALHKGAAVIETLGKSIESLRSDLEATRNLVNKLNIGAHFNGTNCVRIRLQSSPSSSSSAAEAEMVVSSDQNSANSSALVNMTAMVKTNAQEGVIMFLGLTKTVLPQAGQIMGRENDTPDNRTFKWSFLESDNHSSAISLVDTTESKGARNEDLAYEDYIALFLNRGKLVADISCNGRRLLHKDTDINIDNDKWHRVTFELRPNNSRGDISMQIKVLDQGGVSNVHTTIEAKSIGNSSCIISRIHSDDVKCPPTVLYIGGAPPTSNRVTSGNKKSRRSAKNRKSLLSVPSDNNNSNVVIRKFENFVGNIHDIRVDGANLNMWNFDTNTLGHCPQFKPNADFIPSDEIGVK